MPKKILIAIPPGLLEQIDFVAECEHRTRSDLVRECLRQYVEAFRKKHTKLIHAPAPLPILPTDLPTPDKLRDPAAAALDLPSPSRVKSLLS